MKAMIFALYLYGTGRHPNLQMADLLLIASVPFNKVCSSLISLSFHVCCTCDSIDSHMILSTINIYRNLLKERQRSKMSMFYLAQECLY